MQNTVHTRPQEARLLGWYAVRWVHVTDWFKAHTAYRRSQHMPQVSNQHATSPMTEVGVAIPRTHMGTQEGAGAEFGVQVPNPDLSISDKVVNKPHPTRDDSSPMDKHETKQKITEAVHKTQDVLFKATSVFPFTLFPDTISIYRNSVIISRRSFFRTAEIHNLKIEDILTVTPNVGPFFGSIQILTAFVDPTSPHNINYLWRDDALKVSRILRGYIVALKEHIDCSALSNEELTNLFDKLTEDGNKM